MLDVQGLNVWYRREDGSELHIVREVWLRVDAGEIVGLVGESGCGKSQTALAVMGLLGAGARTAGRVVLEGRDLLRLPERELRRVRGNRIAMIFQDPMTALNPHLRIGTQLAEVLEVHRGASRADALAAARRMLDAVRIPAAGRRLSQYPHELSGGMRQRVMIAMALMCRPRLLIADEPTTALDVTIQAQILDLLGELRREFGLGMLLITHDLGVVADLCDRLMVMYAGAIVESGATAELLARPGHPYTLGLIQSLPDLDAPPEHTLRPIPGQPPSPGSRPPGCPFHPRCRYAEPACRDWVPPPQAGHGPVRACRIPVERVRAAPAARDLTD